MFGRVRELRGIGPGIEARLRELVETGAIAELAGLEHLGHGSGQLSELRGQHRMRCEALPTIGC
jgi:hypothetical protein